MDTVESLNTIIKKEADNILHEKGFMAILRSHGKPHISGSYSMDLMTWRDLDIYLEVENINEENFFLLGGKIASCLHPVKMSFRNEIINRTEGLPNGLYWGIYLGDERGGAWKIDVWAVNKSECDRLLKFCSDIQIKLTDNTVANILDIKSQCWKDPSYRRSYTSMDIYNAVLEKGISDIKGFRDYLIMIKENR